MNSIVLLSTHRVSRATLKKLCACIPAIQITSLPPARAAIKYDSLVLGTAYGARGSVRFRWPMRGVKPLTVPLEHAAEVAHRLTLPRLTLPPQSS